MLVSLFFVGLRRWSHRDLSQIARSVYSVKTDSFVLTLRALANTGRVVLGWPLLLIFTGWQLNRLSMAQDFTHAMSSGLIVAAQALAAGLLLYELCWMEGVAKVHFKWTESIRRSIRLSLQWFIPLAFSMTLIVHSVQTTNNAIYMDSLGRLALITFRQPYRAVAYYQYLQKKAPSLDLDWYRVGLGRYQVVMLYADHTSLRNGKKKLKKLGVMVKAR